MAAVKLSGLPAAAVEWKGVGTRHEAALQAASFLHPSLPQKRRKTEELTAPEPVIQERLQKGPMYVMCDNVIVEQLHDTGMTYFCASVVAVSPCLDWWVVKPQQEDIVPGKPICKLRLLLLVSERL